ncbi:MAG: hypothetical protein ACYTG0_16220 [Planctomycetota bacterium]|jgi:hypothetical protein
MSFWLDFWTVVLIVAVVSLTGLAIVVSIGGFFDLKALFRSIDAKHAEEDQLAPGEGQHADQHT